MSVSLSCVGPLRHWRSVRWRSGHAPDGMQTNCAGGSFAPKTEAIKMTDALLPHESIRAAGVPKKRRVGRPMVRAGFLEERA